MKGIIFSEFLEMVEQDYGYEMVDRIITNSNLKSNGVYTRIGTYDHSEMIQMLTHLSTYTNKDIPGVLKLFGYYFFNVIKRDYPQFLQTVDSAFAFLESVETHIHVEVRKLYPDAELPSFQTKTLSDNCLEMTYQSPRKMSAFAEALIEKSLEYYNTDAIVEKDIKVEDESIVRFIITQQ